MDESSNKGGGGIGKGTGVLLPRGFFAALACWAGSEILVSVLFAEEISSSSLSVVCSWESMATLLSTLAPFGLGPGFFLSFGNTIFWKI